MSALLHVEGLSRSYMLGGHRIKALDEVGFTLGPGRIMGIVGESGSGKSTLARLVMALDRPDPGPPSGQVRLNGQDLFALPPRALRRARRDMQMVFQDPYGSLDPRQKVGRIVAEPLHLLPDPPTGRARREIVAQVLHEVGLGAEAMAQYPHAFSGGQRQRIAIARALITRPKLLVADEATSALDLTVQRQILQLIRSLRDRQGLGVLFISHDLAVVEDLCDEVAVMHNGRIVELGAMNEIIARPQSAYTRKLIAAQPSLRGLG